MTGREPCSSNRSAHALSAKKTKGRPRFRCWQVIMRSPGRDCCAAAARLEDLESAAIVLVRVGRRLEREHHRLEDLIDIDVEGSRSHVRAAWVPQCESC